MNLIPYTNVWECDHSLRSASFWMTILSFFVIHKVVHSLFFVIQSEAMNPIPRLNLVGVSYDNNRNHSAPLHSG